MRVTLYTLLLLSTLTFTVQAANKPLNWQSGILLETEKEQVLQGTTKTTNTDITSKNKGSKTDISGDQTTTTTDDYDTFQVYTIQTDTVTYKAKEKLLFPWSKPANVDVGSKVKFAIEKNTLYLVDTDGKQHKAGISKAVAKSVQ